MTLIMARYLIPQICAIFRPNCCLKRPPGATAVAIGHNMSKNGVGEMVGRHDNARLRYHRQQFVTGGAGRRRIDVKSHAPTASGSCMAPCSTSPNI